MESDSIIEEIDAIREALSKASGDDIWKIAEAARVRQAERRVRQAESGRIGVVSREPDDL